MLLRFVLDCAPLDKSLCFVDSSRKPPVPAGGSDPDVEAAGLWPELRSSTNAKTVSNLGSLCSNIIYLFPGGEYSTDRVNVNAMTALRSGCSATTSPAQEALRGMPRLRIAIYVSTETARANPLCKIPVAPSLDGGFPRAENSLLCIPIEWCARFKMDISVLAVPHVV